jgi:hypothetical protein
MACCWSAPLLMSGLVTVAVMVKVHDGLVLATDSATTFQFPNVLPQVYNNADKIFNLHRRLPIAAMTWGLANVGPASISTIAKDLRRRLMDSQKGFEDWTLDVENYSIQRVAERVSEIFHNRLKNAAEEETERLKEAAKQRKAAAKQRGEEVQKEDAASEQFEFADNCLGMLVAGYSASALQSEAWLLWLDGKADNPPTPIEIASHDAVGWVAYAQPRAVDRLFKGFDAELHTALTQAIPEEHHETVAKVLQEQALQPVLAPMPFPDAIHLARFLVEVTAGFTHFLLGPDTVGGTIEVAGVNRHEGFKWINRKHYYSPELNQGVAR